MLAYFAMRRSTFLYFQRRLKVYTKGLNFTKHGQFFFKTVAFPSKIWTQIITDKKVFVKNR